MKLSCGFSQIDITPQPAASVYLDGYGERILPAGEILDPLYAKVCVMRCGSSEFAIVSLDICGLRSPVMERLEDWITLLTGLERSQFALCATHTHAGPACGLLPDLPVNMLYWNWVGQQIASAILQARENSVPGTFRSSFADDFTGGYNRRNKPDIDRRIRVCGFYDDAGLLRGVFANASCHAVCMTGCGISADYPGVLTRRAMDAYPGVPFLFLQGRGADVDPLFWEQEGVDKLGGELTEKVFAALDTLANMTGTHGPIRSLFRKSRIPMCWPGKTEMATELEQQLQKLTENKDKSKARRYADVNIRWLQNAIRELDSGNTDPEITVSFQALSVGRDFVMVFVPFEMLTVTGNAIESAICAMGIDPARCFVIGYANGTNGYLCPSAEHGDGSYEVQGAARWYSLPQCCEASERTVIARLTELTSELLQDK